MGIRKFPGYAAGPERRGPPLVSAAMPKTLVSPAEANLDLAQLKLQLLEAYPTVTEKTLSDAINASLVELDGDAERGRLIRCVCERLTA